MFYFLIFLIILAPAVISVTRILLEKKVGKKEKIFSLSFSIIGTILVSSILFYSNLYVEFLWFKELGQEEVFWKTLWARGILFAIFSVSAFVFLRLNSFFLKGEWDQKIFKLAANVASGVIAVIVGFISSSQWQKFLMFFNSVESGAVDPIFRKDISFYLFSLPIYDYLSSLLLGLSIIACIVLAVSYFTFRDRGFYASGSFILMGFLWTVIWKLILAKYHFLYGEGAVFYGAGYTDIHVILYAYKMIIAISVLGMVVLAGNLLVASFKKHCGKITICVFGTFILAWLVTGIAPAVFQKISVEPNELEKERQYIGYNIQYSRQAYGLDQIEEIEFSLDVSLDALVKNGETLDNVRLWDSRALISSYRKTQALRPYYEFSSIDIDRYVTRGKYLQVMLAPRELDQEKLDARSQTWINKKLKFTHGYGVVLNAVNEFGEGGMPNLLIKDIPPRSSVPEIKITRPEIYYGLLTKEYVIVKTTEPEFDYPQGDMNIYTIYEGKGGVEIGSILRKFALALRFNDKNLLLPSHLKRESRIMFYRQIKERIGIIAPFLKYDRDPYLVIDSQGQLWWIVDAYTVSSSYPYSEPYSKQGINYIRNSVKITINAYDGAVNFYVFDESDPIIRAWMNIFSNLFQSKEKMPEDLISHIRYPETLLYLQAKMYSTYHMTDPQVFYNKEDLWQFGKELYEPGSWLAQLNILEELGNPYPYGSAGGSYAFSRQTLPQEISPYYVIIRLPGNSENEFIQMLPFTPRDKDNLIGWIAGRADGANYGKSLVFKFTKQQLVYGPMQFEARINQKPEITEKFGLWSREGSQVIRGNTLIIPIENSLLYVEPIYIKSNQSEMPEIKKVIVAFGEKLEWGDSFDEAIRKIIGLEFSGQTLQEIVDSAQRHFSEYQRLTIEGKLSEAGAELEKLREDLQRIEELIK